MSDDLCTVTTCIIADPHTHVTDEMRVLLTIDPAMVQPGMWLGDCCAQYAIAMDAKNGDIVWHRSSDWRTYGMHNGWTRVARISPEMPCSN